MPISRPCFWVTQQGSWHCTVEHSTVLYCHTVYWNTWNRSALQCSAVQCSVLQYQNLQLPILLLTALHPAALYCVTLSGSWLNGCRHGKCQNIYTKLSIQNVTGKCVNCAKLKFVTKYRFSLSNIKKQKCCLIPLLCCVTLRVHPWILKVLDWRAMVGLCIPNIT